MISRERENINQPLINSVSHFSRNTSRLLLLRLYDLYLADDFCLYFSLLSFVNYKKKCSSQLGP